MKQDGISIIISMLKGKSKKDVDEMESDGVIPQQVPEKVVTGTKGQMKLEEKTKPSVEYEGKIPARKKTYKDDYEEMGDSGIQMRKRPGGKRFTIGE